MTALEYLELHKPDPTDPNKWNLGITFQVSPVPDRPDSISDDYDKTARHFRFTFTNRPKSGASVKKFTGYYSQGNRHTEDPKAHEILDCLIMDASGADQDFSGWCSDYGFDPDSIRALKIYRKCRETRKRLTYVFPAWEQITESL